MRPKIGTAIDPATFSKAAQSMTLPLEALRIAPVMVRAPSEARKAATHAVSAAVDEVFRSDPCSDSRVIQRLTVAGKLEA